MMREVQLCMRKCLVVGLYGGLGGYWGYLESWDGMLFMD